jgi:hypothetical protein
MWPLTQGRSGGWKTLLNKQRRIKIRPMADINYRPLELKSRFKVRISSIWLCDADWLVCQAESNGLQNIIRKY